MTSLPKPLRGFLRWLILWLAVIALGLVLLGWGIARAQHHHPFHKDFYQHWKQPGSTASCCNARVPGPMGGEVGDCEPTQADLRRGPDGVVRWYAWLRQRQEWLPIPDAKVLRERNPNVFDGHLCWTPSAGVLCFVPPNTGG